MRRHLFAALFTSAMILVGGVNFCYAESASDYMGLTPEQTMQLMQQNRQSDAEMYRAYGEIMREKERNPWAGCMFLGNMVGKDVDEVQALARKSGASHVQWGTITTTSASLAAYRCPPGL
jgi:hypothetical protein